VQGLHAVPRADQPPVNPVRIAFQLMVAAGTAMALLGVIYLLVRLRKRRLPESPLFTGPWSSPARRRSWRSSRAGS
jgi:cytochrome d ubiquinol oxidase subunit I